MADQKDKKMKMNDCISNLILQLQKYDNPKGHKLEYDELKLPVLRAQGIRINKKCCLNKEIGK